MKNKQVIFQDWGLIDYKQGWDGTYNGIKQNMDVYYYHIKAICGNKGDNHVSFKGDVTLIR